MNNEKTAKTKNDSSNLLKFTVFVGHYLTLKGIHKIIKYFIRFLKVDFCLFALNF